MDLSIATRIAESMASIARHVVWSYVVDIADARGFAPCGRLNAMAGSGSSTYHMLRRVDQSDRFSPMEHRLVFGCKMVLAKASEGTACTWLSYKEIQEYNYFAGTITYATLLAHTILHECAHALQVMCRERDHGSVHNDGFYKCLSDLHFACGHEVFTHMVTALRRLGIEQKWPIESSGLCLQKKLDVRPGDLVVGESEEGVSYGIVTRAAKKTIRVYYYQGADSGKLFCYSRGLVSPAPEDGPKPSEELVGELFTKRQKDEKVWLAGLSFYLPGVVKKAGRAYCEVLITSGLRMGQTVSISKELLRSESFKEVSKEMAL